DGPKGAAKRRQEAEEAWTRELLTVTAPPQLKKKVLVVQFKRIMSELSRRWRAWRTKYRAYRAALRKVDMLPHDKRKSAREAIEKPGTEPTVDWFKMVNNLTHSQLFELSLRIQSEARGHEAVVVSGGNYVNPVDEYCAGRKLGGESFGL